ncbi:PD-(D/E)XK nuclease family protein [Pedobacter xixiisoli]|uniref:PD-(D/E)XK nuclease superfamily protein n=1 Tax=Pedobacter xixiisoli TaxID=1476464 RepID=A0A285ZXE5_9SPHI|nr:PD-(D/E)XK nuclease family protein [Pedobacter xixiisoli]SOD14334.1 PD-(D/E)XK nuclease superfamily protein [Pedobacter xixiisoli]
MSNAHFQNLLSQVNNLFARYEKVNELTGNNFNVFRILKLESSEVRMHSAFLAELLNPKGSHGQKDAFLKLFIDMFCYKGRQIDTQSAEVFVEKYIGTVNYEDPDGGRIDIYIKDKYNNYLTIENKIYAGDQDGQLARYHKHAAHSDLFYLTLEGEIPSEKSRRGLEQDKDFKCISYKENIINWLEACRKEVAIIPIVREAISHYINLIKYLTNQTTNHNMEQELTALTKTNFKAAFAIAGNLNHAIQEMATDFGEEMINILKEKGIECDYNIDFGRNYTGIYLGKEEWKYIRIGFQFWARNHNMIFGLTINGTDNWSRPMEIPLQLKEQLKNLPNNEKRNNNWWPWYNHMEETYGNWNKAEAYEAILDGRMRQIFIEKIDMLIEMTKEIER